jgi:Xaa-Pro aminopeptidase
VALAELLRERGLDESRVGVELAAIGPRDSDELRALLPRAELLDCTSLLRIVRAVKTDAEIELLQSAAELSESAAMQALEGAEPGMSTGQISQRFRELIAAAGADFDHFAFALAGVGIATEASAVLGSGETMYADFGVVKGGWFADSGTTFSMGSPDVEGARQHEAVRDAVAAGAAELRPGRRGSHAQAAMQEALAGFGITESYPHGHGVGLEVRDFPLVMRDAGLVIKDDCLELPYDLELEEGMVLNLEAPLFTPGVRSVHCEQTFVITAEGCRPLVRQDRDAPVVATATGGR